MQAGWSLLVVEDDSEFAEILRRRFERRQLHVVVAPSADAALEVAGKHQFHCAIVDGNLAGRDGTRLASNLRDIAPDLKVVMLSGNVDPQFAARAALAGVLQYLTKPCSLAEIEAAVTKSVTASRSNLDVDMSFAPTSD